MTTDIPGRESPLDAMYVMHYAWRAEAAHVETRVSQLAEGGSLQPFRQAFDRRLSPKRDRYDGHYVEPRHAPVAGVPDGGVGGRQSGVDLRGTIRRVRRGDG